MDPEIKKHLDDIVIIVTVALSFLAAIIFAVMMSRGQFFPPTLLAMLLGISVSALTYRFLGGTDGTKFSIGLLGLGGSAALLLGTTWFVGDRLKAEFKIYDDSTSYRNEIAKLTNAVSERDDRVTRHENTIAVLEGKLQKFPAAQTEVSLSAIKKMKPNDELIGAIRRMYKAREYPFVETLKSQPARIAVVGTIGERALYNICRDTHSKLYDGGFSNSWVMVSRSLGANGELASETLDRAGFIGEDICTNAQRQFDIQIGCGTAQKLFADKVTSCAETVGLRGNMLTISALPSD